MLYDGETEAKGSSNHPRLHIQEVAASGFKPRAGLLASHSPAVSPS